MKIERLTASGFRNLQNLDLSINQDFVFLVGPNTAGKSNVLECIYYASVLQAFPPGRTWELIAKDTNHFRLSLVAEGQKYDYYYGRKDDRHYQRSQSVDGARKKAGDFLGFLPTVTFLPHDLNLMQFSPEPRRSFLDDILLQTEPGYENELGELEKIVAQRNELLGHIRAGQATEQELDFWNTKLAAGAENIFKARRKLTEFFNNSLSEGYKELTGRRLPLTFYYATTYPGSQEQFLELLDRNLKKDLAIGRTSVGPHRDDWRIAAADGSNLAHFLSRGEQRGVILCLKLQELEYLSQTLNKTPIILLDELLAELDRGRARHALKHLPTGAQKFLSVNAKEDIPQELVGTSQIIELLDGKVIKQ